MKHKLDMVDRSLLKGRCPNRDGKLKSGLSRKIIWPPCDVWIYEDFDRHHTKCKCTDCSTPAAPPAPSPCGNDLAAATETLDASDVEPESCDNLEEEFVDAQLLDIFGPYDLAAAGTVDHSPTASSSHCVSSNTCDRMDDQALFTCP